MIDQVKPVRRCTILLVATMVATIVGTAVAQDEAPDMAAFMAAMTPGPHHKQMATQAGTWKTTSKMWDQPGQPPTEAVGTSVLESVMDGRFLQEVTKANMMGMPWEGRGVFGYDNTSKKHIGSWYDSFGTMIVNFEGTCDGNCKTISMQAEYFDPMFQATKTMKTVSVRNSPDKAMVTVYDVAKDGTETKMIEIVYARDGEAGQTNR